MIRDSRCFLWVGHKPHTWVDGREVVQCDGLRIETNPCSNQGLHPAHRWGDNCPVHWCNGLEVPDERTAAEANPHAG